MIFDLDRAILGDIGIQFFFVAHTLHQCTGPAVYEALCQAFVEGVGETIFNFTRPVLPVARVFQPVWPVRNERPRSDVGDARGERIYISIGPVSESNLFGKPVFLNVMVARHQEFEECYHQLMMALARNLAIIGNLANIPQFGNRARARAHIADFAVARGSIECGQIVGRARAGQALLARDFAQAFMQAIERAEVELAVAPLQNPDALEVVRFQPLDQIAIERFGATRHAKRAIVHVAAGAAGDLA